eukprot:710061-Pelagomonas_calceolata.AAC.1
MLQSSQCLGGAEQLHSLRPPCVPPVPLRCRHQHLSSPPPPWPPSSLRQQVVAPVAASQQAVASPTTEESSTSAPELRYNGRTCLAEDEFDVREGIGSLREDPLIAKCTPHAQGARGVAREDIIVSTTHGWQELFQGAGHRWVTSTLKHTTLKWGLDQVSHCVGKPTDLA